MIGLGSDKNIGQDSIFVSPLHLGAVHLTKSIKSALTILLVALLSLSSTVMMCEGGTRQCLLWQEGADPPPDPRDPRD